MRISVSHMRTTLTEARKRRGFGWTPERLAEESGVSRATVYRLEAGTITNPSIDTVHRLEDALKLRRGSLVFEAVEAEAAS